MSVRTRCHNGQYVGGSALKSIRNILYAIDMDNFMLWCYDINQELHLETLEQKLLCISCRSQYFILWKLPIFLISFESLKFVFLRVIALLKFLSHRDGAAKKTGVLKLDLSGRFAINIVDNVIVVHHQASKVSSSYFSHSFCYYFNRRLRWCLTLNWVESLTDSWHTITRFYRLCRSSRSN